MGRRDEQPNLALAEEIAAAGDRRAVAQLADIVRCGAARQRNDAMKVL